MTSELKSMTVVTGLALASGASAEAPENFITHQIDQAPQVAAGLFADYTAMNDDWSLSGQFDMMGGAAVGMKLYLDAKRGYVVQAGLHDLAIVPWSNIAF